MIICVIVQFVFLGILGSESDTPFSKIFGSQTNLNGPKIAKEEIKKEKETGKPSTYSMSVDVDDLTNKDSDTNLNADTAQQDTVIIMEDHVSHAVEENPIEPECVIHIKNNVNQGDWNLNDQFHKLKKSFIPKTAEDIRLENGGRIWINPPDFEIS
jgi:hypothetical protein